MENEKGSRRRFFEITGLIFIFVTVLFGDNIYQQINGRSIYTDISTWLNLSNTDTNGKFTPYPTYNPQITRTPLVGVFTETNIPLEYTASPETAFSSVEGTGPFRDHQTASIGTDVFVQVTFSDGLASFDEDWLQTYHYRYQRIRPEENPDGCGVSIYETDKVWFSSSAYTFFTVNDQEIGQLVVATGKHGYIFDYQIHVGDKLCAVNFEQSGYSIIIGPDMYYHYDSFCYRGHC